VGLDPRQSGDGDQPIAVEAVDRPDRESVQGLMASQGVHHPPRGGDIGRRAPRGADVAHRLGITVDGMQRVRVVVGPRTDAEPIGLDRQGDAPRPQRAAHGQVAVRRRSLAGDDEPVSVVEGAPAGILRVDVEHIRLDRPVQPALQLGQQGMAGTGAVVRRIGVDAEQLGAARSDPVLRERDDLPRPLRDEEMTVLCDRGRLGARSQI
jgi:hypothetical protein